jgi:hypothetical protein
MTQTLTFDEWWDKLVEDFTKGWSAWPWIIGGPAKPKDYKEWYTPTVEQIDKLKATKEDYRDDYDRGLAPSAGLTW